jgi:hypothetical protein
MLRPMPIIRALSAAPSIWPSPAMATTAKDSTMVCAPTPGTSEVVGEASAPPSAASAAPKVKVSSVTFAASMPMAVAASLSVVTATITRPVSVRRRNQARPASVASATPGRTKIW